MLKPLSFSVHRRDDSDVQESVTLEDMAIDLTSEEWALLDMTQRKLFREVMLENIGHLVSMGYQHSRSDVLFPLEQEELWSLGSKFPQGQSAGGENALKEERTALQHRNRKKTSAGTAVQLSHGPAEGAECDREGLPHHSRAPQRLPAHTEKKPHVGKECQRPLSQLPHRDQHTQIPGKGKACECCLWKTLQRLLQPEAARDEPHRRAAVRVRVCGNAFVQSSDLRKHSLPHSGEARSRPGAACAAGPSACPRTCSSTSACTPASSPTRALCSKAFSKCSALRRGTREPTGQRRSRGPPDTAL